MHEMAYAEGILAVALDVADGQEVRRIQVRIGALHRIVADSLQFSFQVAAQDTPAAEAELEMHEVPARVRCQSCGVESAAGTLPLQCGACGAFDVEVAAGEEVLVDAVELDSGWRRRPEEAAGDSSRAACTRDHRREHARADAEATARADPR